MTRRVADVIRESRNALAKISEEEEDLEDDYDDYDDDDDDREPTFFYCVLVKHEGEKEPPSLVKFYKSENHWHEKWVAGTKLNNFGGTRHMGYFKVSDLVGYLKRDYERYWEVIGPIEDLEDAKSEFEANGGTTQAKQR